MVVWINNGNISRRINGATWTVMTKYETFWRHDLCNYVSDIPHTLRIFFRGILLDIACCSAWPTVVSNSFQFETKTYICFTDYGLVLSLCITIFQSSIVFIRLWLSFKKHGRSNQTIPHTKYHKVIWYLNSPQGEFDKKNGDLKPVFNA